MTQTLRENETCDPLVTVDDANKQSLARIHDVIAMSITDPHASMDAYTKGYNEALTAFQETTTIACSFAITNAERLIVIRALIVSILLKAEIQGLSSTSNANGYQSGFSAGEKTLAQEIEKILG